MHLSGTNIVKSLYVFSTLVLVAVMQHWLMQIADRKFKQNVNELLNKSYEFEFVKIIAV